MKELETNNNIFESIKHIDEIGNEFWYARELMKVLEYSSWQKFNTVLNNAEIACKNSNQTIENYFNQMVKMVPIGSNTS